MGEEGEVGRGGQGNKGAPWLPTQPPGSHGIVEVGFELCMCVKLLGEGGLGGGEQAPWDSRGPQLSSHLFYGFFNKIISDDVQHLVKIPPLHTPQTTRKKKFRKINK